MKLVTVLLEKLNEAVTGLESEIIRKDTKYEDLKIHCTRLQNLAVRAADVDCERDERQEIYVKIVKRILNYRI